MIWFAPHLLSAYAVHAQADPDLPDGLHLRIVPAQSLGLPITPFLIYPLPTSLLRQHAGTYVANDGTRRALLPDTLPPDQAIVAVQASTHGARDWIAAMHGDGLRVVARRSMQPLVVAAPRFDHIHVSPDVGSVALFATRPSDLQKHIMGDSPYEPLSLPVEGPLPWYAGGAGPGAGKQRAMHGAPRRTSPVDTPDGAWQQLTPDDEWRRIEREAGEIDRLLRAMLGREQVLPHEALIEQQGLDDNGVPQSVSSQITSDLMLRSADPGLARYLGLATLLQPGDRVMSDLPALGAVALFALPVAVRSQLEAFGGLPDEETGRQAVDRFVELFPEAARIVDIARGKGMWVGAISTVAAAPPPPDAPVIPSMFAQHGRWISNEGGGAFAQGFVIRRPPVAPLVAVARREGKWVSRHDLEASGRRNLRLVGIRPDPNPPSMQPPEIQGIAFDQPVPGSAPPRYRFALGDFFGRYGPFSQCDPSVPPRPVPPAPAPQTSIRRAFGLPATGAASPGTLHIRLPVPPLDDLALGALPIVAARIALATAVHTEAAGSAPHIAVSYPLPALSPQEMVELALDIRFVDSAGTQSEPYRETLRLADARAPRPVPASYGLIWTSRPGPAKEVELALTWPAPAGQRHRVYIADAAGLGLGGSTRAAVADAGVKRALDGQIAGAAFRKAFRLLSDAPVEAEAGGRAVFRAGLPRALQTVQFVRIVPISAAGVEADFDACGLVPVAVPADRAPPPPRLRALPAGDGHLQLRIEATGLNLDLLRQAEPGLFDSPPSGSAHAPEYRLRRASGAVPDPIYAREIARGRLGLEQADGATLAAATVTDAAAPAPFVRYTYWAEIRMPPERRALTGEQPVAGGVSGVSSMQMADHPSRWSPVSAPLTVVHAPPAPPAAPDAENVSVTILPAAAGPRVDVTLRQAPLPGPGGAWHLRLWRGWDGAPLDRVFDDLEITAADVQWSETGPAGASAATIAIALVDPLGRQGAMTTLSA